MLLSGGNSYARSCLPTQENARRPPGGSFGFERLEERFVLNGQAVLANDAFSVHENGPQLSLNVLANDVFDAQYTGNRLITSVSFGSQGGRLSIAADRRSLLYTPPADFSGIESFVYAVDGEHTAQVDVTIDAPLAPDEFTVTPNGQTRQLDVLANDPFWVGYTGPRKITSVSVGSAGGKVAISADRKSILYTAPEDLESDEIFTYVVDDLYPARVTIHSPMTLAPDNFDVVKHTPPTTLHVLDNDPFWAGYSGAKKSLRSPRAGSAPRSKSRAMASRSFTRSRQIMGTTSSLTCSTIHSSMS